MMSFMTKEEDYALAALVHALPRGARIFELGTGVGGSARVMLEARNDVELVTVDNLSLRKPRLRSTLQDLKLGPMTQDDLIRLALAPYGHRVRRFTDTAAALKEEAGEFFELILVDGAHDYESVVRDLAQVLPYVAEDGGIIAFHDYGNEAGRGGVVQAVTDWRIADRRYWDEVLHVGYLIAFARRAP